MLIVEIRLRLYFAPMPKESNILHSPQGDFRLSRYPVRRRDPLRAWDAADEYLLRHLDESGAEPGRTLVVNDGFGALSVALAGSCSVMMQSDSYLAWQGVLRNLRANGLEEGAVTFIDSLAEPEGPFTHVLLKIPKSLALLEDQLFRVRPLLAEGATLVAGAMARHVHRSTLALFERIIGPAPTSLAWKKARLVLPSLDPSLAPGRSQWPRDFELDGLRIINHAGVFSRERLDIGTRFFLEHLPTLPPGTEAVDLGCGNGIVGIMLRRSNPGVKLLFSDESFMALASARENWAAAFGDEPARFVADDCLARQPDGSADLVLINPPFHQQHAVTAEIARRMFRDARRVLRRGGECRIVANRHLGYHRDLKRLFGRCELVAGNAKFVVLSARKR